MAKKETQQTDPVAELKPEIEIASSSESDDSSDDDSSDDDGADAVSGLDDAAVAAASGHSVNKAIIGASDKKKKTGAKRGILYIGRIPHGFYEKEMKKYFAQFGDIVNVCVARNKSGKSKHFGFIEFADYDTAVVAQETMNNYLLFGHQLQVAFVTDKVDDLFTRPQKYHHVAVPMREKSQKKHDGKRPAHKVEKLEHKHAERKQQKALELKAKGIDWQL
ncbi:hypothetical protein DIURU_004293 [Diutina rugosa]|uniref:RRM domain-containing protein n=1 Tax=Diutina rugosa TaxID=5481 RepID=A0A642UI87_DIURU|nr:uncharacterized protein DIURU_004293 [Diutina rugosa]KAA8899451.1 hypothetical protein DIURU_004293 [Diutina rugosa]